MKYSKEIIEKYDGCSAKELVDAGICPTCFDRQTKGHVFGDDTLQRVYEDKDIVCLFVGSPRAAGHMIISTKEHYHDMSEAPDKLNEKIIRYSSQLMKIICDVFGCERVYLCTMCDGPMNHYHMQLIPRYKEEERGKMNFVKPRKEYKYDKEKFDAVKHLLEEYSNKKEAGRTI